MSPRKLLVASALSLGPTSSPAGPAVDVCRVTGNVVTGQSKGPGGMCALDEARAVRLAEAEIDPENPRSCAVVGTRAPGGCAIRIGPELVTFPVPSTTTPVPAPTPKAS